MTLPNFLIVGAMKAGTTWLASNLETHPQVFIPKDELHFFNESKFFQRGFDWYEDQFKAAGNAIAIGEKTAGYLLHKDTPEVLAKSLPNVKIIIVLRDPVRRAVSQINHHIRYGEISPDLSPENLINSSEFSYIDKKFAILERGKYLEQIKRYYSHFKSENILILVNETDIRKSPEEVLRKTCQFLKIDSQFDFPMRNKRIHENRNSKLGTTLAFKLPIIRPILAKIDRFIPGDKIPPFNLQESEIRKLFSIYEDDNRRLFEFLGIELPGKWIY